MTRRSHPTDEELIRYLEGEVTQSRAGQIIVLAESSAAERKRIESLERMLSLVAQPDERITDLDLVAAVREQIARGEQPAKRARSQLGLIALGAVVAALLLVSTPFLSREEETVKLEAPTAPAPTARENQPEARKQRRERQILSWLSLEEQR